MLSIIIPTKNEPYIQELVEKVNKELSGLSREIIVVDLSDTPPELKGAKLVRQKSRGLGNAFLEGFAVSKGEFVALMDGDGSHSAHDLKKLFQSIDGYEMAWGSKLVSGGKTEDSFSRQLVTLGFSLITRGLLWIPVKDSMSGFAVYKREVLEKVVKKLQPRGFKINLEIYYKSRARAVEVPIIFHLRKAGESTAGWNLRGVKEALRILSLLFDLKIGRLLGKW